MSEFNYPYIPCSLCYEEEKEDEVNQIEGEDWKINICHNCEEIIKELDAPDRYGTKLTRKWSKLADYQRNKIFKVLK